MKGPRVSAAKALKALKRHGFEVVRQSGSHCILRNAEGRRVTLPLHARKTLHPKLVRSIAADAGMALEDLFG